MKLTFVKIVFKKVKTKPSLQGFSTIALLMFQIALHLGKASCTVWCFTAGAGLCPVVLMSPHINWCLHSMHQQAAFTWGSEDFSWFTSAQFSHSVQYSSVVQSCSILCDPIDCSTPGFPVHHQLLELTQTHIHRAGNAIQLSHPLSSPSPALTLPSIRVFSDESILFISWPKYWSFSFNISSSNEHQD